VRTLNALIYTLNALIYTLNALMYALMMHYDARVNARVDIRVNAYTMQFT